MEGDPRQTDGNNGATALAELPETEMRRMAAPETPGTLGSAAVIKAMTLEQIDWFTAQPTEIPFTD